MTAVIRGECIAIVTAMSDGKLGVLVGFRHMDSKQWPGYMQFPGGKCEGHVEYTYPGVTLVREVYEETGFNLTGEMYKCMGVSEHTWPDGGAYELTSYAFYHFGGAIDLMKHITNKEPDKNVSWQVLPLHDLIANHPANMLPGMYEVLCRL